MSSKYHLHFSGRLCFVTKQEIELFPCADIASNFLLLLLVPDWPSMRQHLRLCQKQLMILIANWKLLYNLGKSISFVYMLIRSKCFERDIFLETSFFDLASTLGMVTLFVYINSWWCSVPTVSRCTLVY